jgi:hypothetical protein
VSIGQGARREVVAHLVQVRKLVANLTQWLPRHEYLLPTLASIFFRLVGLYVILKFFNMPIPLSNFYGTLGLRSQLPSF